MFRKSGQRRFSQSDDLSSISSSEEESLSDSSSSPTIPFPDPPNHNRVNESSKVSQVTHALVSAYRCVTTILEPEPETKSMGWVSLGRTLAILGKHGNDTKVRAALNIDTLLNVLLVIVKHQVIPLAESKQYLRSISKEDFRATYSVLHQWSTLSPMITHMEEDKLATILSTSKRILYRFLIYKLESRHGLDLSALNLGMREDMDQLDLTLYLDLLNIPSRSVISVRFNNNSLDHIPLHFLSPFPRLNHLDVSKNRIRCFPLYITRLPITSVKWTGRRPDIPKSVPRIQRKLWLGDQPRLPPRRLQSLVQHCIISLRRSLFNFKDHEMDLSNRTQDLIADSYTCEVCDRLCLAGSQDWIKEVKLSYNYMGARSIPVGGGVCTMCLEFLLAPGGAVDKKALAAQR